MRRFMVPASILVVVLVGTITSRATLNTIAQEATPTAMAGHPVIGAWRFDTNVDDPANPPSYAIFHADGTYMEFHPSVGTGIGVWEPTGERTAEQREPASRVSRWHCSGRQFRSGH